MKIEQNKLLKDLTTFKIGGPAEFFVDAKSVDELREALKWAEKEGIQSHILGGGSNVLIPDEGLAGLVIRISIPGITILDEDGRQATVRVGAGVNWDFFVKWAVEKGLWGVENLSYIPGSVGAAPVQNIGAYGVEVKEVIDHVVVIDRKGMSEKRMSNKECEFGYRTSFFKKEKGRFIVTTVVLRLEKNGAPNLSYPDLANSLDAQGSLRQMREIVISIRKNKLPDINKLGTAGSFFKNPVVAEDLALSLKERFPEMPVFEAGDGLKKLSLAWIIDHVCGLKGIREGDIGVYENQALVIANYGRGNYSDVERLTSRIIKEVKEKTSVDIEREVEVMSAIT